MRKNKFLKTLDIYCPLCEASPDRCCMNTMNPFYPTKRPHKEKILAARALNKWIWDVETIKDAYLAE